MPVYSGPQEVIIVQPHVPQDVQPAPDVVFDTNDGSIARGFFSGPYQFQKLVKMFVIGGSSTPTPPLPPPTPIPVIPFAADPPFPPVWPYYFSTDTVYGRDGVGVINVMVRENTYIMENQAIQESDNLALDLTGCTLTLTAKFNQSDPDDEAVFILASPSNGIVITDATGGLYTVTIPKEATTEVPKIKTILYFDILYTLGDLAFTILRGQFVVLPNITG